MIEEIIAIIGATSIFGIITGTIGIFINPFNELGFTIWFWSVITFLVMYAFSSTGGDTDDRHTN